MRVLLLLCGILWFALPVMAETELPVGVSTLDFGGVFLGQAPDDDMICTRGPCYSVEEEAVPKSRQFVFSIYKKPSDITHYGKVEIAAPQYYFFENQLFQILFKVQCGPDEVESCLDRVAAGLHQDYKLMVIETHASRTLSTREYRTASGAVVQLLRNEAGIAVPDWPSVKIFDPTLMDTVRQYLNPNYLPAVSR